MAKVGMSIEKQLMAHIAKRWKVSPHVFMKSIEYQNPSLKIQEYRKTEKRLFQLLCMLPHWGVGRLVTSIDTFHNKNPTFWRVTRIHVDKESEGMDCGFAWGIKTEHGRNEGYEKEIPYINEHLWRLIPKHSEDHYLSYQPQSHEIEEVPTYIPMPPLLAAMTKAENSEKFKDAGQEPMVRLLIPRSKWSRERQRYPDGSLV